MTLTEFRTRFPEFEPTADTQVTAQLAAAELFVSDSWDDDERDEVVALRAASLLATSAIGRGVGVAGQSITKDNAYANRFKVLLESHACCYSRNG